MQIIFSLLFIIFALIGLADASFISYEMANYSLPPCSEGFDCAAVLTSQYAHIGPLSLSNLGIFYYIVILTLAILHYIEFDFGKYKIFKHSLLEHVQPFDLLLAGTGLGFLVSLYLLSLMAFVIQAWCLYCLVSAISSATLFFLVQIYHAKYNQASSFFVKRITLNSVHQVYKYLAKPFFFLIDPAIVHETMTRIGSALGSFGIFQFLTRWVFNFRHPVLVKDIDGIGFVNPVGLSAGYDYNADLTQIISEVGFGFQTVGTVTYRPYEGNPGKPFGRFPHSKALLVNKGLKSKGAHKVIENLTGLEFKIPIGISIGSTNTHYKSDLEQITDIAKCFFLFEKSQVNHSFYEMNISCPNTFGGEPFTTPERLDDLLTVLDTLRISRPVYVKMPIDQSENESLQLLKVINKHNVQGLIIGNLTKDKENPALTETDRAIWKQKKGNVSGKPTFERSNKLIALAKKQYGKRFTIIGTGGIFSYEDAQEKMKRGADIVQLITGMIFEGPTLIGKINMQLADHLLNKPTK